MKYISFRRQWFPAHHRNRLVFFKFVFSYLPIIRHTCLKVWIYHQSQSLATPTHPPPRSAALWLPRSLILSIIVHVLISSTFHCPFFPLISSLSSLITSTEASLFLFYTCIDTFLMYLATLNWHDQILCEFLSFMFCTFNHRLLNPL